MSTSDYLMVQPVHQLWPPEDTACCSDFDIVFFHGVQKPGKTYAWKSTWVQDTHAQEFWVKDWLPQDLDGNVRVFALSYDSCAIESKNEGQSEDIDDLGRNAFKNLFTNSKELGQQCGCVLVGHSLGGLVIKSLVVEAHKRGQFRAMNRLDEMIVKFANRFLQNLRGVVNYAVPHNGSFLESYFTLGHKLYGQVKLAGFMKHLKPFPPYPRQLLDLSIMFERISHEKSIPVFSFLEGKPLKDVVSNDFLC
jgi:hypothetical protein